MLDLTGNKLSSLPVTGLQVVRDLDRHDGPLLTHLKHPRGDHYLYYWCDCDDSLHRWMLVRVSETSILRLINKVIPLDTVIPKACLDDFVYFVDVGPKGQAKATVLVALSRIPASYVPGGGSYIEVPETCGERSYSVLIEESLTVESIGALPRIFSRAYAVLYALFVLKPQKYEEVPWSDKFNGMKFYDWLLHRIPGEDRPGVDAFQYASPGFIRFSVDQDVANLVSMSVRTMAENEENISTAYWTLYKYIKDNNLSPQGKQPTASRPDISHHSSRLTDLTRRLLDSAKINDQDALVKAAPPLEAAKVALSFIRRLRELNKFERDGIVRFPAAI